MLPSLKNTTGFHQKKQSLDTVKKGMKGGRALLLGMDDVITVGMAGIDAKTTKNIEIDKKFKLPQPLVLHGKGKEKPFYSARPSLVPNLN